VAQRLGIHLFGVVTIAVAAIGCRADRFRDADLLPLSEVSMQRLARSQATPQSTALHTSGETLAQRHLLQGPHALQDYVHLALTQNPDILAARKRVEALAFRVPVARSLPDPALTTVAQPAPVQTAAGEFQFILNANQKFPWFGKLDARASLAEAEASVARAELAAVELETVSKVKKTCYELAYVQQAIMVTETERKLLEQLQSVATSRYETGQTTLQDVLRADLEIAALENSLISLRQRKVAERAKLARLLHVAPDTELEPPADLPDTQLPRDLESLRQQAVAARPQLHAAMTRITKERRAVNLARLDYKPDVTLGFAWIDVADAGLAPSSNGQDAVLLTAGINLPIYRKRLDASVHSAEASSVASARQYDSLKDATMEAVTELFAKAESHTQMLALFTDDILPKAEQTLEVSTQAYAVGDIDFLQLLDNWQQLLRYELGRERLKADLQQTLADLEQVVGGWTTTKTRLAPEIEEVPLPPEPAAAEPLPPEPA
jgi:cobalt-zinc-cadmium efflux system outer membrane protein